MKQGKNINDGYAKKIINTKPVVCDTESQLEIHTLVCRQHLGFSLWSLKTLCHYAEFQPRLVLYDDGSLREGAIKLLSNHFLHCEIIRRDQFHRDMESFLKDYKSSLEYSRLKFFYCVLKLFGPMAYAKSDKFLYLDSDVLFFQKPVEMLQHMEQGTPFYNSDYQDFYSCSVDHLKQLLGVDVQHKINAGLFSISREAFAGNMDLVESFFEKAPDLRNKGLFVNRHEQTLAAILLSKAGAVRLSSNYQISRMPVTDKTVSHHYVSDGSRPNFFLQGIKRLKATDFIEEYERRM